MNGAFPREIPGILDQRVTPQCLGGSSRFQGLRSRLCWASEIFQLSCCESSNRALSSIVFPRILPRSWAQALPQNAAIDFAQMWEESCRCCQFQFSAMLWCIFVFPRSAFGIIGILSIGTEALQLSCCELEGRSDEQCAFLQSSVHA